MVDCPCCGGTGSDFEDGLVVKCDVCYGKGRITEHDYEQWERNVLDVYEAQRQYIRELTAD